MLIALAVVLLLLAAIIIMLPFFKPTNVAPADVPVDQKLLALYTLRDQLYQAIREAKFDLDTGKLTPEDYERQVMQLKRQAANVLKAIDKREANLVAPEWDAQIEQLVRAERQAGGSMRPALATAMPAAVSGQSVRYCPQCGTRLHEGDRFCPACGARVA